MASCLQQRFRPAFGVSSDSPLEGDGFELPVPRALQGRRPKAITAASAACRRRSIICGCVGRHQRRRAEAKSRNRKPYRARNRKILWGGRRGGGNFVAAF